MRHEPVKDHAERKRILSLIEQCEKEQMMSDDLIKREDAIKAVAKYISINYSTEEMAREDAELLLEQIPSVDRPQGYWTKTDVATYRCSECGKIQIADDVNELNFCCCCGSRNNTRMKGVDNAQR